MPFRGDLTIEWDEGNHEAVVKQLQAMIERGVVFYGAGKLRRSTALMPITRADEITDRAVVIRVADVDKLVAEAVEKLDLFRR